MRAKSVVVFLVAVLCGAVMVMGQTEWVNDPNNPLFGPGDVGSWDEGGPWARAAVFDGSMYHLYFTGSFSNGLPNDMGHATSPNGAEWTVDPSNPVLIRGEIGEWDEHRLDGASVVYDGSLFHMWYSGWGDDEFERVGYATSPDGSVWTKRTVPVLEPSSYPTAWDPGVVGNPYVIFDGATYHMWYTGGIESNSALDPNIGYAYSGDGIEWTKHRNNPVVTANNAITYHSPVLFDGSTWRMWYTTWDGSIDQIHQATADYGAGIPGLDNWQFIPAVRLEDFIHYGERRRILFGSESADMRTNIGCQNGGIRNVAVFFGLYSADGTSLGRPFVILDPLSNDQVNRIFDGHNPVDGYVDVWTATPDRLFYCYGSVLDNVTSDPTTILPQ